ncbi:MAG: MTAP family purine nucleoside phosphorylase [Candidatus Altiarchaeota archaeon]
MIGVLGGTGLADGFLREYRKTRIKTPYGTVTVLRGDDILLVQRHGADRKTPPHMINHKANAYALKKAGISTVVGVNSSGSLKRNIKPGYFVVPHDYINFYNVQTYYDRTIKHITPGLSEDIRERIIKAARKEKVKLVERGVYFQTRGPRLETKAEIRMIKDYADIIGMTMGTEATLCKELGLEYASLCTVDNYANGIADERIDFEEIFKKSRKKSEKVKRVLYTIAGEL